MIIFYIVLIFSKKSYNLSIKSSIYHLCRIIMKFSDLILVPSSPPPSPLPSRLLLPTGIWREVRYGICFLIFHIFIVGFYDFHVFLWNYISFKEFNYLLLNVFIYFLQSHYEILYNNIVSTIIIIFIIITYPSIFQSPNLLKTKIHYPWTLSTTTTTYKHTQIDWGEYTSGTGAQAHTHKGE